MTRKSDRIWSALWPALAWGAVIYIVYVFLSVASAFLLSHAFAGLMTQLNHVALDCLGVSRADDLSLFKAPVFWAGLAAALVFVKKLFKK